MSIGRNVCRQDTDAPSRHGFSWLLAPCVLLACILLAPHAVLAADVEIDASVDTTDAQFLQPNPTHVWISDTQGFVIYEDVNALTLASTTDAGATWGNSTTVYATTTLVSHAVWYDQWTPGDTTGTKVHIAFITSDTNDIYYVQYDTVADTTSAAVTNTTAEGATLAAGTNEVAIVKATDGDLYVSTDDATDSFFYNCAGTCTTAGNWSAAADPWGAARGNDPHMLRPLSAGAIMLIHWDDSTDDIESNVYTPGTNTWSGFDTSVNQNEANNTTYDGSTLSSTINRSTGAVYLAYLGDSGTLADGTSDIEVWKYTGSWSQLSNAATNVSGALQAVKIAVDEGTGNLYVAYVRRTTAGTATSGDIYYKVSTNDGTSWSSESAAVNSQQSGDLYGLNMNIMSTERLSITWKYIDGSNVDDLQHATIADLVPPGPPVMETTFASNIGAASATLHGSITSIGVGNPTQHGFAYSTNSSLSTGVSTTTLGSFTGIGNFSGGIGPLSNDTTYYFRAYATNAAGTGYGGIKSFTTGNTTATRSMRLFGGFTLKFYNGRVRLYQQ